MNLPGKLEVENRDSGVAGVLLRPAFASQRPTHNAEHGCIPTRHAGKPRILYIITRAEHGGAQKHVFSLACSMQEEFDVAVAIGEVGYLTEACRDRGIPVHLVPHLQRNVSPLADARAFWELRQLIRRLQPDLIHAHTSKSGFLSRLAGYLLGVPSIYTMHTWLFGTALLSRVWAYIGAPCERLAAQWCRRLITVCEEGARVVLSRQVAPPSKVAIIRNGIPDCSERANLSSGRTPVITMVARFSEPKDFELLLRAFASIPAGPRLRLVGDGPLRENCEKLARELAIRDRVDFLGDRDDVPALLASSDVFVLASKTEMMPISILEAMRAGLPVIASDVGGIRELIVDGESGLAVPPGSVPALAQALAEVTTSLELRQRLGRAARRRFSELFLYSRQEELTRSVYLDVLFESGIAIPGVSSDARAA
jgi:glycosyltransferase involved in cell wall biosynthesis